MSTTENPSTDIESGRRRRQRRRRRRLPSVAGSSETTTTDGSLGFSDSDEDRSPLDSTAGGSLDECGLSEIEGVKGGTSASEGVDLESGDLELKLQLAKERRDCRICQLKLMPNRRGGGGSGVAIELGCSCKGDLAAAHKQCAETWFKIRGNTTCEICGATALNVVGDQINEANNAIASATAAPAVAVVRAETTRNFWHGRRVMNILLACMVFAFVISWLFHFNVLA